MTSMPQVGAFGVSVPYESGYRDQRGDERENATLAYMRSRDEAQDSRQWQLDMSNTSWQRGVSDMKAAGINPMLAVSQGGASTPAGAMGQVTKAQTPQMASVGGSIQLQTAAQVELLHAQADRERAQAENLRGVDREHKTQDIVNLKQAVGESAMRIEKIIADTDHATASAANVQQQTKNLQAEIPRLRELVIQLKNINLANMPQIERHIANLQYAIQQLSVAGHQQSSTVAESWLGRLAATLKALNPLLPNTTIHHRGN